MSYPFLLVPAGETIPLLFTSYDANGASVTLTGLALADILIYKNGSVTQRASTAGYTLLDTDGIDFDAVTGLHGISINTGDNTDAGFYAVGSWYTVVISTVTISAQTVTFIAGMFRIMKAEGVAGVPKADVDSIAGVAVSTTTAQLGVNVVQGAGTAWNSGAIGAATLATDTIAATKIATGAITSGKFAASAIDAAAIATGAITAAKFAAGAIDAAAIATGAIDADALAAGTITAAKFGASAIDATAIATGAITAAKFGAGAVDAAALATDAVNEIADGILARTLGTEAYAADAAVPTLAQMQFMIWSALSEFAISGTTITAKKLDGTTTAMTFTLDSATTPTSRTRAT